MTTKPPSGAARAVARSRPAFLAAAALGLAGCQSYSPAPLDIAAHRAEFAARLEPTEPLRAFVQRLSERESPPAGGFDLADGVSLPEAEVLALFYNPDLRLARLEANVALADAEHAGRWSDPEFGFDGAEVLSPEGPFEYGLTLSLTIPVSGRLGVERARARAAHEAELRRVVDLEWSTRTRVRAAWSTWTAARERAALLDEVVASAAALGGIVESLASVGELSRIEARAFEVERIGMRSERMRASLAERHARLELLALMGVSPDAAVDLVPSLHAAPAPNADDPADRLIAANTTLAVRRAAYQEAEQSLRLEVRKQYPDITIGGGYGNEGDDRLLLGVSLPVPIFNANKGGIARARAERDLARAAAYVEFERLLGRLEMASAGLDAAVAQREAYEATLTPLLDAQDADIARLAELGEVDTLLVLDSIRRGFEARDRVLALRLAESLASIELAGLLGPNEPLAPAPADSEEDDQ